MVVKVDAADDLAWLKAMRFAELPVAAKLKEANMKERRFDDVVKLNHRRRHHAPIIAKPQHASCLSCLDHPVHQASVFHWRAKILSFERCRERPEHHVLVVIVSVS